MVTLVTWVRLLPDSIYRNCASCGLSWFMAVAPGLFVGAGLSLAPAGPGKRRYSQRAQQVACTGRQFSQGLSQDADTFHAKCQLSESAALLAPAGANIFGAAFGQAHVAHQIIAVLKQQ